MPRRWLAPDFFTDEKLKRVTIAERLLAAAMIANQDDDGRLRGDPAYLRSIAFLYDDYSLNEVREMRDHLASANPNIIVYENSGDEYIQLRRYQRYQRPRYYHASKFPAPPGWPFGEEKAVTEQQPHSNSAVTTQPPKSAPVVTTDLDLDLDLDKGKGEGKGKEPHPTPTLVSLSLFQALTDSFYKAWGRMPESRETAQLRDLGKEISSAGGATAKQVHDAFREAALQNKMHVSYIRAILLDWLGIQRGPPKGGSRGGGVDG